MKKEWCLIAGAAGDIGQSVCQLFRASGFRVVAMDYAQPTSSVDKWIDVDLSGSDDGVVARLSSELDQLDVRHVVSLIGGTSVEELCASDISELSLDAIRHAIEINLIANFTVVLAALGALRRVDGDRSITFVSSINALGGYGAPAYSAAKAGLSGLVASLGESLSSESIRTNAVALGTTDTSNLRSLFRALGRSWDPLALGMRTARGSILRPEEAARTVFSVAVSCDSVTGQVIIADSGQSLKRR